jgi:hypothetical protein
MGFTKTHQCSPKIVEGRRGPQLLQGKGRGEKLWAQGPRARGDSAGEVVTAGH